MLLLIAPLCTDTRNEFLRQYPSARMRSYSGGTPSTSTTVRSVPSPYQGEIAVPQEWATAMQGVVGCPSRYSTPEHCAPHRWVLLDSPASVLGWGWVGPQPSVLHFKPPPTHSWGCPPCKASKAQFRMGTKAPPLAGAQGRSTATKVSS